MGGESSSFKSWLQTQHMWEILQVWHALFLMFCECLGRRPWVQGQWCCWANNLTSPYLIHTCLPLSLFLLGQVWCCKWQTIYWLGVLTSERSASSCMRQATTWLGNLWHHPPPALNNLEHGVVGLSKDQWLSPSPPSHTLHNTART